MKSRFLITMALAVCLVLVFATPTLADSGKVPNAPYKPTEWSVIDIDEVIPGLGLVQVDGYGVIKGHVVQPKTPGKNPTYEESWFAVDSFVGTIYINSVPLAIYPEPGVEDVRVMLHFGGQPSQPLVILRSSTPFYVPIVYDYCTMVQMVGGEIIFAR